MFFEGCDMDIKKQFSLIAKEYDATRRKFIPCFDGFYETATKIILSNIKPPARVLDLGAGTGLLTYFWHKECPSAEYVLADISDEMLEVSKKRFAGLGNIKHIVMDYTKALSEGGFDIIISALSIHHLEDEEYQKTQALFPSFNRACAYGTPARRGRTCTRRAGCRAAGAPTPRRFSSRRQSSRRCPRPRA